MLIVLIALVAGWLVLNAGLLAAVALAHRSGQRKVVRGTSSPRPTLVAPVRPLHPGR
jgi:hypothetical protein